MIREGEKAGHEKPVLEEARSSCYDSFVRSYQRMQTLFSDNPARIHNLVDGRSVLESQERRGLTERFDTDKHNPAKVAQRIQSYENA